MATGNVVSTLAALLTLDDHQFNDRMEAAPATAERNLGEVAQSAHRNLSRVGAEAERAYGAMQAAAVNASNGAREAMQRYVEEASRHLDSFEANAQQSFENIAGMAMRYLSFGALFGAGANAFSKFTVQEDAVEGLRATLEGFGQATEEAMQRYQDFASEIQKTTKFGDEGTLAAMSNGLRLGLDPKNIEEATRAAVGLTEKLKVDLNTAMTLVARAANGSTTMLSKYGMKLDETMSKEEKFNEVLRQGNAAFHLAEKAAETAAGQMGTMWNDVGDALEDVGKALAEYILPVVSIIKSAAVAFKGLSDTSKRLIVGLGAAAAGMAAFRLAGGGILGMAARLIPMLAGMGTAAAGAGASAGAAATGFTAFWTAVAGPAALALAGIVAINAALKKMDSYYDEAIARAEDAQVVAQNMRASLQGENAERTAAIKRLKEIGTFGHLNNATQQEANSLIEKYGLNMKVANGQLVNMGDSFDTLIKKQEELARKQLAFTYQKEILAVESELEAAQAKASGLWEAFKRGAMLPFGGKTAADKEVERIRGKLSELEKTRDAALEGGASQTASQAAQETEKATRPALEALKKQREEYRLAAMDARELKRELEAQSETLGNQISQHESLDDYTDEELGKLKEMEEIHNRILGIYEESAKYIQKQNDDLKAYNRERSRELASRQFDKEFDRRLSGAKTREDDQSILDVTNKRVAVAKRKAQQALAWYNKQLEIANDDKIITDKEKEQLDKRLQNLKDADALVEKETERREKAVEAIENRAAKRQEEAIEAIENRAAKRQEERNRRRAEALQRQAAQISRRLGMIGMGNLDRGGFAFDRNGRFRGNVGAGALARFSRRRDSMAETRAKIEAMNAGQRTYINAAGKERRVHFSLQDKRNMREVEKLEERRRRLEERAKDYTKPIEDVKVAVEELGKNAMIVKR